MVPRVCKLDFTKHLFEITTSMTYWDGFITSSSRCWLCWVANALAFFCLILSFQETTGPGVNVNRRSRKRVAESQPPQAVAGCLPKLPLLLGKWWSIIGMEEPISTKKHFSIESSAISVSHATPTLAWEIPYIMSVLVIIVFKMAISTYPKRAVVLEWYGDFMGGNDDLMGFNDGFMMISWWFNAIEWWFNRIQWWFNGNGEWYFRVQSSVSCFPDDFSYLWRPPKDATSPLLLSSQPDFVHPEIARSISSHDSVTSWFSICDKAGKKNSSWRFSGWI